MNNTIENKLSNNKIMKASLMYLMSALPSLLLHVQLHILSVAWSSIFDPNFENIFSLCWKGGLKWCKVVGTYFTLGIAVGHSMVVKKRQTFLHKGVDETMPRVVWNFVSFGKCCVFVLIIGLGFVVLVCWSLSIRMILICM